MKRLFCLIAVLMLIALAGASATAATKTKDACGPICKSCSSTCTQTLKYLEKDSGKHAAVISTVKECIAACDKRRTDATSAKECGDICAKCATACEDLKDPKLKSCISQCKKCADYCKKG